MTTATIYCAFLNESMHDALLQYSQSLTEIIFILSTIIKTLQLIIDISFCTLFSLLNENVLQLLKTFFLFRVEVKLLYYDAVYNWATRFFFFYKNQ